MDPRICILSSFQLPGGAGPTSLGATRGEPLFESHSMDRPEPTVSQLYVAFGKWFISHVASNYAKVESLQR